MLRFLMSAALAMALAAPVAAVAQGRVVTELMSFYPGGADQFVVSPDRRSVFVVVSRDGLEKGAQRQTSLRAYAVAKPASPKLPADVRLGDFTRGGGEEHSLYSPELSIGDAYFLAAPDMVVATAWDRHRPGATGVLLILRSGRQAFDPTALRAADAATLREYQALKEHANGSLPTSGYDRLAAELAAAGAEQALHLPIELIRRADLVSVLNNWGFWQSRGSAPLDAVPTLRRVTEIAPGRAVAWDNLGDAIRRGLTGELTESERARLTRLALDAYGRYHTLTGKASAEAADFTAFNTLNAPTELCARIAAYRNHSRMGEISVTRGTFDPDGSGRKVKLEVRYGGSLVLPYVFAEDDAGHEVANVISSDHGTVAHTPGDSMLLIPFGDRVYALDLSSAGPEAVWDWQGRFVCHFTASATLAIVQSEDDGICRTLLEGPLPAASLPSRPFTGEPIDIEADLDRSFWTVGGDVGVQAVVDADLSETGHPDHVGYFTGFSPHGGCEMAGVVLLDGDKQQQGPRNAALLDAEWDLRDCRSAHAEIVRDKNRLFVEFDSERMSARNEVAKRTLLRVTGSGVQTVCRIVATATYAATRN